jgi:hypothetical protein
MWCLSLGVSISLRVDVLMVLEDMQALYYLLLIALFQVVDGYSAPVTSGNFVDLVSKGFYKDMAIQRSDGFIIQVQNHECSAC